LLQDKELNQNMAGKTKNKKALQRNTSEVVQVNSHTYGKHTRAARGSKTIATINDVLTTHAEKTNTLNTAAKAVYDVLKLYSKGFREGQLWQAMLSRMRKGKSTHFEELLHTLERLELNSRYALTRFGEPPVLSIKNNKRELQIEMHQNTPPHLNKNDNCYQYELIAMLFNSEGVCVQHTMHETKWFNKKEAIHKEVYTIQKPEIAKHYLLCLCLQSGINGIASDTLATKGMAIVSAGSVLRERDT
jgi:hypothetical protein